MSDVMCGACQSTSRTWHRSDPTRCFPEVDLQGSRGRWRQDVSSGLVIGFFSNKSSHTGIYTRCACFLSRNCTEIYRQTISAGYKACQPKSLPLLATDWVACKHFMSSCLYVTTYSTEYRAWNIRRHLGENYLKELPDDLFSKQRNLDSV